MPPNRRQMRDPDRLFVTVARYFKRMGNAEFPTVRRIQRTLRWSYERIAQAVEDDPEGRMFTTSHDASPEPTVGEHYVEIYW